MWKAALICALLSVVNQAFASTIIDTQPEGIKSIVSSLCKDNTSRHSKRISRVSTIVDLINYFEAGSFDEEIAACRDQYLKPLHDLKSVLGTSYDNICSIEKIRSIDNFHWVYIVGGLSRKWRDASYKNLPEPLRMFFMHYANEITEQCKKTLADRLNSAVSDKSVQSELLYDNKLGSLIDGLSIALVTKSHVKNYDNFLLIWNQIFDKERRKGHVFKKNIDNLSREPVIALMKAKDPTNVWSVQHQCRHNFRPIYEQTVLPVMRLVEIGYGSVDGHSKEEVPSNELIGDWYAITQLCELLAPINFYRDESMKQGEATIMSGPEEAEGLEGSNNIVPVDQLPSISSIKPVQLNSDVLLSATEDKIIKQVESSLKVRNRMFRKLFKNVLSSMKGQFKSKLKNFFVSKKIKNNSYIQESGDKVLAESEAEAEESLKPLDGEEVNEKSPNAIVRTKRSFWNKEKSEKEEEKQEFDRFGWPIQNNRENNMRIYTEDDARQMMKRFYKGVCFVIILIIVGVIVFAIVAGASHG